MITPIEFGAYVGYFFGVFAGLLAFKLANLYEKSIQNPTLQKYEKQN